MFWLKLLFAGLWGMVWHMGIGIGLIILLLAAAFFSEAIPIIGPLLTPIRKHLIWAAIAIGVFLFGESVGIKDELARCTAQNQVIQDTVNDAVKDATKPDNKRPDPFDSPNN